MSLHAQSRRAEASADKLEGRMRPDAFCVVGLRKMARDQDEIRDEDRQSSIKYLGASN